MAAILGLIRDKRARLMEVERQAMMLGRGLAAVRDAIRDGEVRPSRQERTVWPSSVAGRARTALQQAGRQTRVERLLPAVNRLPGPKISAATLVGELARDVRQGGRLFRRTAPGEYALAGVRRGRRPS